MKKLLITTLFLGCLAAGFSHVGTTVSYYRNDGASAANLLNATTLDLAVNASDFTPSEIAAGESSQKMITVSNEGGVDFQYTVESGNFTGDSVFCNTLNLDAVLDGKNVYSGKLSSFVSNATSSHFGWVFNVSLPSNINPGSAACDFDFVFKGWQQDAASFETSGYRDLETLSNHISEKIIESAPKKLKLQSIQDVPEETGTTTPDEDVSPEPPPSPPETVLDENAVLPSEDAVTEEPASQ